MNKRLCTTILLLAMTAVRLTLAQTTRYFAGDEWLGSSTVNDLLQDQQGCLWVATQGGLTRYDSHTFRTYRQGEDGLRGNDVLRLCEDARGRLVIGTSTGVQRFSPATLRFADIHLFADEQEKQACRVNALLARRNGDVLIATSGVGVFVLNPNDEKAHYADGLKYPELIDVKDMLETDDGTLWMAAANYGVLRISNGKLTTYDIGAQPAYSICQSRDGDICASGIAGGVLRYDSGRDLFVCITGTERLAVNRLSACADGGLLVATDGQGICYIKQGQIVVDAVHNKVGIAIEDHDGNLWAGISQKGLLLEPKQPSLFQYFGNRSAERNVIGIHAVSAIFHDHNGTLWVGTDGDGLYRLSDGKHFGNVPANILSMAEDDEGRLYLASWLNGCGLFNPQTGRYEQFDFTRQGDAAHVMSIAIDQWQRLWIGTNGDGLKCLNLKTGELTEHHALGKPELTGQENGLTNAWVGGLSVSPDGKRLYLALSSGVGCLDLQSLSFVKPFGRNHLLAGHAVNDVREDSLGMVWVATADGLYRIDNSQLPARKNNAQTHCELSIVKYELKDGLPDNNIASLEFGGDGQIWIGTQHGLSCHDVATGLFRNYFKADGLQGNEFLRGASRRLHDGRLAFGGTGGLTLFQPKDIGPSTASLRVRLLGMTIDGQEVGTLTRSGWYQVCDTTVCCATRFDLAHNDNSFTLAFSTMDYLRADGLHYEYRIGSDSLWQRLPMGVHTLTLSHLAPGTYRISIRAVTGSTVSDNCSLTVMVHPAWYATTLAKIAYCLLAILLVGYYLHRRRQMEQLRLRVQEHIHAAQMREAEPQQAHPSTPKGRDIELHIAEETAGLSNQTPPLLEGLGEALTPHIPTPDDRLMERVMKVVNAHITDSGLSVEQIASEVGISRSHLHRKMKELTGESTGDFVRNIRLKRAAYLLEGGHHSIAEVMYACGFDNPSGFSSRFKKFYGVSPSEYMKEHQ